MLPAGDVTEKAIFELTGLLAAGDTIIEGGNSYFRTTCVAPRLQPEGIHYVADIAHARRRVGKSNGATASLTPVVKRGGRPRSDLGGARAGLGLRYPSDARARDGREPPEIGPLHSGPYDACAFRQDDPQRHRIRPDAGLRRRSLTILRTRLRHAFPAEHPLRERRRHRRGVAARQRHHLVAARSHRAALTERPISRRLHRIRRDSGEGRWTVMAAIEEAVPADVLSAALYARFRSRQEHTFAENPLRDAKGLRPLRNRRA